MTDDLAKLKQQLNNIMNRNDQKIRPINKSSDNLYAPHQRANAASQNQVSPSISSPNFIND